MRFKVTRQFTESTSYCGKSGPRVHKKGVCGSMIPAATGLHGPGKEEMGWSQREGT